MQTTCPNSGDSAELLREQIIAALDHLDHVLPGQAPLHDFVHHNTLHGFQHLPFEEALEKFEALTGIHGYLPETESRNLYRNGRINDQDLSAGLASCPELLPEQVVFVLNGKTITREAVYKIALLFDLSAVTPSQLNWQIEEMDALKDLQADVPEAIRKQLLVSESSPAKAVKRLWLIILKTLGLQQYALHPEDMLDLSIEQAEDWLSQALPDKNMELRRLFGASVRQYSQQQASMALDELLGQLGDSITLRGFVAALSGIDILDSVRPQLIRTCASALDEGIAAWQMPERSNLGFYPAWRATLLYDANPFLHELPDWLQIITELPLDAVDTILLQLSRLEIPQEKWEGYLRRLALEVPGWSGLINWRQHHPHYHANNNAAPKLADYLAIRLTLDRLWLNQVCRYCWQIEAKLSTLQAYFRKNLSEFTVRKHLYQLNLPEYLADLAESLSAQTSSERHNRLAWQELADQIWTWQSSPITENNDGISVYDTGWRLFRLFQHLGLNAEQVQQLEKSDLLQLINLLDNFNASQRGQVWLVAYENNYREAFFQALRANHNRGRWKKREKRPEAQIVFCMDDREESFRRHLEELNPEIETLGAAGFFGLAMNYQGLDDSFLTPLCPVVVTPAHNVREDPRKGNDSVLLRHNTGRKLSLGISNQLHQGLRRNLLVSQPVINTIAPIALVGLLAKSLLPKSQNRLVSAIARLVSPNPETELSYTSTDHTRIASPDSPKPGFTDVEQADRVAGFLRTIGLTTGFAPLVVLMGHGSISQNNPHLAAYDCGACSGRHGGPNARLFAAMVNRPEVRALLGERGIVIPPDTWFIGSEHNTCNEEISWYDQNEIPDTYRPCL